MCSRIYLYVISHLHFRALSVSWKRFTMKRTECTTQWKYLARGNWWRKREYLAGYPRAGRAPIPWQKFTRRSQSWKNSITLMSWNWSKCSTILTRTISTWSSSWSTGARFSLYPPKILWQRKRPGDIFATSLWESNIVSQ